MTPPIAWSWLPSRQIAIVTRLAAWPIFWLGARAVAPGHEVGIATAAILLQWLLTGLGAIAPPRVRPATEIASGGLVLAAFVPAARLGIQATGLGASTGVATAIAVATGGLVGGGFAVALYATRKRRGIEPLDTRASYLVPTALWLALAAFATRFDGEAVHVHIGPREVSTVLAFAASIVAITALTIWLRHASWIERLYRGEAKPFVVAPGREDAAAPRLVGRIAGDATIAIATVTPDATPYRQIDPREIYAHVPSSAGALRADARRRMLAAASAVVLGAGAMTFAFLQEPARVGHPTSVVERPLGLPNDCRANDAPLRELLFVPLEPLVTTNAHWLADRYRRTHGLVTHVAPPLARDPKFFDPSRRQVIAERILAAAKANHLPIPGRLVIIVTDEDMYMQGESWRYAFATRDGANAVVSLARMNPRFPFSDEASYQPRVTECDVELHARATKMITRQIFSTSCPTDRTFSDDSVRRPSVLGLADLDAIDEAIY